MHKEIEITFSGGAANQIMHLGPLELKGGETKYLPTENGIGTLDQLKKIGSLSVREVTVADEKDKIEELGKDVVVREKSKVVVVTYIGNQLEKPMGILGSFYKDRPRTDLTKEQISLLISDKDFRTEEK